MASQRKHGYGNHRDHFHPADKTFTYEIHPAAPAAPEGHHHPAPPPHVAPAPTPAPHVTPAPAPAPAPAPPPAPVVLPPSADLQKEMPPIWDQGDIGSCTAHASLAGYLMVAGVEKLTEPMPDRLYQYYNSRLLEGTETEDAGASIRSAILAQNQYGICAESLFPYDTTKVLVKPPAACYQAAKAHHTLDYVRVPTTLDQFKAVIASNDVVVFGIDCYSAIQDNHAAQTGFVAMPAAGEQSEGGHAICLVGYDDNLVDPVTGIKGWIKFRNSWGTGWGAQGYGYLPYAYFSHIFDAWRINKVN